MNTLHIYPTSRALRSIRKSYRLEDGFCPTLMRMDAFEQRSIVLENKLHIDPLQRILLLRKSAKFERFEGLKWDLSLIKFFSKSDALFKFFEELSAENVNFSTLAEADAYVEFAQHLELLERLQNNYQHLLEEEGMIDKAFVPQNYRLNTGFLEAYSSIEVHIEGYLTYFELSLLQKISESLSLIIHYTSSDFNLKMQERFKDIGIDLPNNKHLIFSLTDKSILEARDNTATITAQVYSVEERLEQVAVAFAKIEEMVQSGIPAEEIVLVLPDEGFKEHFMLFDTLNNLNFAMGYDYSRGYIYKSLEALYGYWQGFDDKSKVLLERYGFNIEAIEALTHQQSQGVEEFFILIDSFGLHESPLHTGEKKEKYNEQVYEKYFHFTKILEKEKMPLKSWLFLWLKTLSKLTKDDVRGGKITVMGVLETRGVIFKGVVIVDFNEGIVPASSPKDQFLNATVRAFANLPSKSDREALQKQYYKRLLEDADSSVIIYSTSDNTLASKFLYELGLGKAEASMAQFDLLYSQKSQLQASSIPIVEDFDATAITWSASRLKTYLQCKRKYYYRYIQKLQAKKEKTRNEGAFLHTLLEHLHKEKKYFESEKEMKNEMDRLLDILLPYEDAKTNYEKLLWKAKLKGFIVSQIAHFKAGWRIVETEEEFQFPIRGIKFKGRIDRIDQNKTQTLVLDYKSGSIVQAQKIKNLETLTDLQMSIYHQMLKERYPNIRLGFIKLFENGELEEITALDAKDNRLFEIIDTLKELKSFEATKCDSLLECKFCEFTLLCERGEYL
jgi:RecB family exonuclease